jgi:hypothetical protein
MLCALLAVVFTVLCAQPIPVQAATATPSSELAGFGFSVNASNYSYCYSLGKSTKTITDAAGHQILQMTTRIWVLRDNNSSAGDYYDVVLVWTEIVPLEYRINKNEIYIKAKGYPESLKTTFFPPEYRTSSPKSQTVSTTYSVGASAGADTLGFSAGISGSVSTQKNCLVITNQSNSPVNRSQIFYDYRPNIIYDSRFDYIGSTTEQIGITYIHSNNTSYPINMASNVNCGYVSLGVVFNGSNCVSSTQNRSFRPLF